MSFFFRLAVNVAYILYSLSLVYGTPISQSSNDVPRTFSITQVPNPSFNSTDGSGPAAMRFAFNKYNIPLPRQLSDLSSSGLIASVPANPFPSPYDLEYLVPVSIGSTAQILNLDLDTGSADLWVFSTQTPTSEVNGQIRYNPIASTTSYLLPKENWSITYGDGSSSSGDIYTDRVCLGGLSFPAQAVESAQQVSSAFTSDSASSGLIGLAFSNLNQAYPMMQKTWFDNVKSQLAQQLFTANLKRGAVGTYNFGYIDNTLYTGSIGYAPVSTKRGLWEFTASGYQIGTQGFVASSIDAIADTGTTLLFLPQVVVLAYYAGVVGGYYEASVEAYIFPCSSKLPAFTFGLGSYRGVVPGTYMNYGRLTSYWCYGGIQSQGNLPFSIFGDILLKAQFVVFDTGSLRIGFANKKT